MRPIGIRPTPRLARLVDGYPGEPRIRREPLGHAAGFGQAGTDADDPNAFAGISRAEPGGRQHQRRIGRAAGEMRRRGDLAAAADDGDDHPAPARSHPLHDRINDIDIGKEFGVERLAPRGGRQLVDRRSFGGPGGIDEDVNRAEAVFDRLDHVRRRGGVD